MVKLTALVAIVTVGLSPMSAWGQTVDPIRRVDFLNFSYAPNCIDETAGIVVADGSFFSSSEERRGSFDVLDVEYGDLTGDGREEAIVLTNCNGGGTGQFTDGYLYTLSNGAPNLVAQLGAGDRAFGGINRIRISNGLVEVVRNDGGDEAGGACCPEFVATTTLRLRGNNLVPEGNPVRRRIQPAEDVRAQRINFARGRISTALNGSTVRGDTYVLGAQANQNLVVNLSSERSNANLRVLGADLQPLGPVTNNSFSGRLPRTGDYVITVESTGGIANYVLEVIIPPLR